MSFWSKKPDRSGNGTTKAGADPSPPNSANPTLAIVPAPQPTAPNAKTATVEADPTPEQQRRMAATSKMLAAAFGEIIAVMMRSKHHRTYALADLEWLVLPAVLTGQYALAAARTKTKGIAAPVAVVLWASVSAEVDQRVCAALDQPIKLAPKEWKSGETFWVVEAIGEPRILQALLKQLSDTHWVGKTVKLRTRDRDGKPQVGTLKVAQPAAG